MIPTMYIVYGVIALGVLLSAALYKVWLRLFGVVIVPKDAIGIVNKKFALFGKNKQLPPGNVIALNGEAGIQADTLAPGLHTGYYPWQFDVTLQPFIQIPQGKIGTAEADVIKLKISSMEPEKYASIEVAKPLSGSGFKLVPDVVVGGNGSDGGGEEGNSPSPSKTLAPKTHQTTGEQVV